LWKISFPIDKIVVSAPVKMSPEDSNSLAINVIDLEESGVVAPRSQEEVIKKIKEIINPSLLPLNLEGEIPQQLTSTAICAYQEAYLGRAYQKGEKASQSLAVTQIKKTLGQYFGPEYASSYLINRMVSVFPEEMPAVALRLAHWRRLLPSIKQKCGDLYPLILLDLCLFTAQRRIEERVRKINSEEMRPGPKPEEAAKFWQTQLREIGYWLGFEDRAEPKIVQDGTVYFGDRKTLDQARFIWRATILQIRTIQMEVKKGKTKAMRNMVLPLLAANNVHLARKKLIEVIATSPLAFPEEVKLQLGLTPEKIEETRKRLALQKAQAAKQRGEKALQARWGDKKALTSPD
jgi:hypothetical protein